MEQERPDESGKSTGVWDGKRPYSFDEFDDEPPVQPKLRRFTSSSHTRLQVRALEQNDLGRRAVPPEIMQLSDADSVVALGQTSSGMCDVVNKENVASSDLPNNLGDNAENKTNGTPVKVSLRVIPGADNESDTNLNRTDRKVTDQSGSRGVSDPGQSQERASQQQGSGQELDGCHGVLYVYSQQLIDHCNLLPRIPDRVCTR